MNKIQKNIIKILKHVKLMIIKFLYIIMQNTLIKICLIIFKKQIKCFYIKLWILN